MSTAGQTSRYTSHIYRGNSAKQNSNEWKTKKSPDRIGYKDQYPSKTASYYSASKDINNR